MPDRSAALGVILALCLASAPRAQQGPPPFKPTQNPVTDGLRMRADRDLKNLVAAADLMPADKYGFKPTPAQWSFGELMAHVAQSNLGLCAYLSPAMPDDATVKLMQTVAGTQPKADLVAAVRKSQEFCNSIFAKMTDAGIGDEAAVGPMRTGQSRAAVMITLAADWADHYSTAASYLRLNGILPPSATQN
jgi:hypothetical protein